MHAGKRGRRFLEQGWLHVAGGRDPSTLDRQPRSWLKGVAGERKAESLLRSHDAEHVSYSQQFPYRPNFGKCREPAAVSFSHLSIRIIFPVISTEVKEFAALLASRFAWVCRPLILTPVWELVAWKINVQVPKLEARSIDITSHRQNLIDHGPMVGGTVHLLSLVSVSRSVSFSA